MMTWWLNNYYVNFWPKYFWAADDLVIGQWMQTLNGRIDESMDANIERKNYWIN